MKIYAEMVYSSQRSFGILSYDTYKDYEYLVLSFGTHPCAYIRADKLDNASRFPVRQVSMKIAMEVLLSVKNQWEGT